MSNTRRYQVRAAVSAAPTSEIGRVSVGGVMPWSSLGWVEQTERVPELIWPNSIMTYDQMRTDSQIHGLYLGVTLPIRRYRWMISPNGARATIVNQISEDFNLPVQGKEDKPSGRVRDRFSWDEFLRHALLALAYGFYYFEMVGEIRNGLWRLTRLAPRPPGTIVEVNVLDNGDLLNIRQALGVNSPAIPANRLVPFAWEREGGNWFGRSLFRHMYKNWLIKDRLLRIDAIKHERNGLGVPFFEAPPGATAAEITELNALAMRFRAGDHAGAAVPSGTKPRLMGTEGSIPDTLASINYHDEAMARALLMMFIQLGQTQTGSRALGETFTDYFNLAQETIALWIEDTVAQYAIEDWVTWNYGEDEPAPRITHDRNPDPELAVQDLADLIAKGAVVVDTELENYIRERYKLPPKSEEEPPPTPPAAQPQLVPAEPATVPAVPPEQPSPTAAKVRRKRTEAAVSGQSLLPLPIRPLRRQPYRQEVTAAVDYAQMDQDYQTAKTALVADVSAQQAQQLQEIREKIIAAGGDLKKLAKLQATPIHEVTILARMTQMAQTGVYQVINEAKRQGVSVAMPNMETVLRRLQNRATAVDSLLARSLSEAAGRKALMMTGPQTMTPTAVADTVYEYLNGLSTRYLEDQLGGALQQAMNAGRKEVMDVSSPEPQQIYASELLDDATCEPCVDVDGTEYPDLDAAEADYPTGGYMDCLGGPRCRGTLIAVYNEIPEETG